MNNTEIKIATEIETDTFYSIIKKLKKNGWKLVAEYDERIFDKGIDFDLYKFEKYNETILLAWSNWFEGEIKASYKTLMELKKYSNFYLKFGNPEYLQNPKIIEEMKSLLIIKK